MTVKTSCLTAALALLLSGWGVGQAHAQLITPAGASGTGTFNNSPSLIINNVIPAEGSTWTDPTNVWWTGNVPQFTIDFGQVYTLQDLVLSLDNNDTYAIEYSTDNATFTPLITVSAAVGEIGNGMDTFSTVLGNPEFVVGIDFAPVQARYLRAFATGGDGSNSIGEIQSFGVLPSASAAPEPSAVALLSAGFLGLMGRRAFRRRK
jgi:hypothetical protein